MDKKKRFYMLETYLYSIVHKSTLAALTSKDLYIERLYAAWSNLIVSSKISILFYLMVTKEMKLDRFNAYFISEF